jgi:pimeloyl-ACP methyl ester carboxylesterase
MSGDGEPLVLIHGGMLDSRMWDDQIGEYAKHYRVLRYGTLRNRPGITSRF